MDSTVISALALAFFTGVTYPQGMAIVLRYLGDPALMRHALAYLTGAAAVTVCSGAAALVALRGSGLTERQHPTPSAGIQIFLGVALLAVAAWLARHRLLARIRGSGLSERAQPALEGQRACDDRQVAHPEAQVPGTLEAEGPDEVGGRASDMATARRGAKGIFLLGVITYLPSLLYIGAIKNLVDADLNVGFAVLSMLACAALVLLMVEVPIILRLLAPQRTGAILTSYNAWMRRHGHTLVIVLSAVGGVYFLVTGIASLLESG